MALGPVITIPAHALVLLVGPSGCGKTTFARRHFPSSAVLSSDAFRAMIADDENDQAASRDAFAALHLVAAARLRRGRLTVVDATNLRRPARLALLRLAAARHRPVTAIAFDVPRHVLGARSLARADRRLPADVLDRQQEQLASALGDLRDEAFHEVVVLASTAAVEAVRIVTEPSDRRAAREGSEAAIRGRNRPASESGSSVDRRSDHGPFDIIGDVHGCIDELVALLETLGYRIERGAAPHLDHAATVIPPANRRLVLLGDLVDRGPSTPDVLRIAMAVVRGGQGYAVLGNHDWKLLRALWGRSVRVSHGLAESLAQLDAEPAVFRAEVQAFLESLPAHLVLDGGRLVVAHAGLPAALQGSKSRPAREFALYGETTGESDEFGLPVRRNWALGYAGAAAVVYGHTAVRRAEWLNGTIDIDTGCVFGGRLTALLWPERELVAVPAARTYYEPGRPMVDRIDHRPFLGGEPA